jgi:glutamyl/glutaminyl-tRNA synthetase
LQKVIVLLKPRVKLIPDFARYGGYFFRDPVQYEEAARDKQWKEPEAAARLEKLAAQLTALKEFSQQAVEAAVRHLAEELGISASKLIHSARLAVTGFGVSPGLFETMALLGKNRVVARLHNAVKILQAD